LEFAQNSKAVAQAEGFSPLAARPARQLSITDFAIMLPFIQSPQGKAFCSHKTALLVQSAVFFALGHRKRPLMRLLISPLKSIINTFLKGKLVPRIPLHLV